MNTQNFVRGLQILHGACKDKSGYDIGAEHDQVYFWGKAILEETQIAELRELGWFQPEQEEDAPYDPEESWSAFV